MQAMHRCGRRRAEINLNREPQGRQKVISDRERQEQQTEIPIPVQGRLLRSLQRSLPLSLCLPWRGIRFEPAEKGGENSVYMDPYNNPHNPTADVVHEFGEGGEPGSEMAILFYGSGSVTLWIYEWVE